MEKVARTLTERQLGAQFRDLSVNCLAHADDIDVITEDIEDTENIVTEFKGTGRSEGVLFYLQSSEHEFIIRD